MKQAANSIHGPQGLAAYRKETVTGACRKVRCRGSHWRAFLSPMKYSGTLKAEFWMPVGNGGANGAF